MVWLLGAVALGYAVTSRRQQYDFDGRARVRPWLCKAGSSVFILRLRRRPG